MPSKRKPCYDNHAFIFRKRGPAPKHKPIDASEISGIDIVTVPVGKTSYGIEYDDVAYTEKERARKREVWHRNKHLYNKARYAARKGQKGMTTAEQRQRALKLPS